MDPKLGGELPEALVIVSSVESHCGESVWREERSIRMVIIDCTPTELAIKEKKGKRMRKGQAD